MYKCKHFAIQELLPEDYYLIQYPIYGDRLWMVFDVRMLMTLDMVRNLHGPMVMNTWYRTDWIDAYGRHEWRGLRDHNSPYVQRDDSEFGNISQHRYGRAGDPVPLKVSAQFIRDDIRNNPNRLEYRYIRGIEENIGWFHFDTRGENTIQYF